MEAVARGERPDPRPQRLPVDGSREARPEGPLQVRARAVELRAPDEGVTPCGGIGGPAPGAPEVGEQCARVRSEVGAASVAAQVDLRQPDARRRRVLRRVLYPVSLEVPFRRQLVRSDPTRGEPHHLHQVAPDHQVAPFEPEPARHALERVAIAGLLADEAAETHEPLPYGLVLAIEAARERFAVEDLLVDGVPDERVLGGATRRRTVLLHPSLAEPCEIGGTDHDAGPALPAGLRPPPGA